MKTRSQKQINIRSRNKQDGETKNPQLKRKEESPERVLNETEESKLSDFEFKIIIIRKLNELSELNKEL